MIGLLGTGAILTSAIIGASVVLPTAKTWMDEGDQGKDLARAATVVAEKADDLNTSFLDITPIQVQDTNPVDPTSEYLPVPAHNSAVAPAFETLAVIDAGVGTPFDNPVQARITAIENLQSAWTPRYQQSKTEYERLVLRIEHADSAAKDYFKYQNELTTQIHNPQDRERSQIADKRDIQLYRGWREQANETLNHATVIMRDLSDMDIMITKQALSANFASVYIDVQRVPSAIKEFHRELGQFRLKLDEINTKFNNADAPTADDWIRGNSS